MSSGSNTSSTQQVFGYLGYLYVPDVFHSFRHHWSFTKKKWDDAEVPRICPSSCQRLSDSPAFVVVFWWCFGWSTEKQKNKLFSLFSGGFVCHYGVYIYIYQDQASIIVSCVTLDMTNGRSFLTFRVGSDFIKTGYFRVWINVGKYGIQFD